MEAPTASWALPCVICPSGIRCLIRNVWQHLRISAPKNINHDVIDDCFTNFCSVNANKISFDVFSEKYTSYASSDRTVQIPKSNFKKIQSTNSIIGVYAYTNLQYDVKASWGSDYVYLLIKKTDAVVNIPVNVIVFFC